MNSAQVTHEAILASHREATWHKIRETKGPVLILHDATEPDFTNHRSLADDLGQIGNGNRHGYVAQNSLAVNPKTGQVIGLCNKVLHYREDVPKDEPTPQKRERELRESRFWLRGSDPLANSEKLVEVCDRGADTFEFLKHELASGRRSVIRASHIKTENQITHRDGN